MERKSETRGFHVAEGRMKSGSIRSEHRMGVRVGGVLKSLFETDTVGQREIESALRPDDDDVHD